MEVVRVVQGSMSDSKFTNVVLNLFRLIGVRYKVSVASCHRDSLELPAFVEGFKERIVLFIGGHSLAAPGVIRGILIGLRKVDRMVHAIPLDVAARSAIEDLPPGVPVHTCGLNTIDVNASIINGALAVASVVSMCADGEAVKVGLQAWYDTNRKKKKFTPEIELDENGLIPIPETKKQPE